MEIDEQTYQKMFPNLPISYQQFQQAREQLRQKKLAATMKSSGGGGRKSSGGTTKKQSAASIKQSLRQDINSYYRTGKQNTEWATENELLPMLYDAYPEIAASTIKSEAYALRKSYETPKSNPVSAAANRGVSAIQSALKNIWR